MTDRYGCPMFSRISAAAVAAALTLTLVSSAASAQESAERRATTLSLVGNGFGHGHGMSQYGAQGRATAGESDQQILNFYYPGTDRGRAGGTVAVLITEDKTRDVTVAARSGLSVSQVGGPKSVKLSAAKPAATKWRIVPSGAKSRVEFFRGSWRKLTTLPGPAEFSAGGKPIELFVTGKKRVEYRGELRAISGDTVNIVGLEDYLKGVVPQEVPATWRPEAVQAQAIAARTYAAHERRQPLAQHYQLCDTSQCQAYGGYSAEHAASNAAIAATARQILTYGGKPAFAQYSASNGGQTAAGSFPYLAAKPDPFDKAFRGWTDSVTAAEIEKAYPAIGTFQGAAIDKRDGKGQWGGRVLTITLTGSNTSTTISGETFRAVFGLNSSFFTIA